jgi:hypothetical protein
MEAVTKKKEEWVSRWVLKGKQAERTAWEYKDRGRV